MLESVLTLVPQMVPTPGVDFRGNPFLNEGSIVLTDNHSK